MNEKKLSAQGFNALSTDEMLNTDGGIVTVTIFGVTVAAKTLLMIAGSCAGAGIAAGVTIGLNRKNRQ